MTTPPLDLTGDLTDLLHDFPDAEFLDIPRGHLLALLDRLEAAEDERDKAQRACQTLGRVIDRQCEDALQATDSQDLMWGDDGDGDWAAVWERVLGLGEKAREATARAEAAERDLAAVTVSRDGWQARAEAAEKKVSAVREDIDAAIADAPPANYEEDNYDAGFVHGLVAARDIIGTEKGDNTVTMTCNYCGAEVTGSVHEVLAWDKTHRDHCTAQEES